MNGMTIGRLASAAQVGVETVRFYQRRGLQVVRVNAQHCDIRLIVRFARGLCREGATVGKADDDFARALDDVLVRQDKPLR